MGARNWLGASKKEYGFATYPVFLPADITGVARFYTNKSIVYCFVSYGPNGAFFPTYFGAAKDGGQQLAYEYERMHKDLGFASTCYELHVMLAPAADGPRGQVLEDLLAANPTAKTGFYAASPAPLIGHSAA